MDNRYEEIKKTWETSFQAQISDDAYNTAPVEALVRNISYYLRSRYKKDDFKNLHFLELGCGTGPNLIWLAKKGIKVSGIDISSTALKLCEANLTAHNLKNKVDKLIEGSVTNVPFPDNFFDGIIEACVFQHLNKNERKQAFEEVNRLLKPGGVFAGYMLAQNHTVFEQKKTEQLIDDTGTLILQDKKSDYYITSIGLSHFFSKEEICEYLKKFSMIDPCLTTYYLPKEEAEKRGYKEYLHAMWNVYAVK